jgi:hypothetical protein
MAKRIKASVSPVSGGLQRKGDTTEFNPDYTFVKRDLKRIAVLAGSIFAVMIALSFFIN